MIYSNVDGLVSKRLEIEDIIRNEEPMIICFCETKLNSEISLEAMCWRNYDVWRRDRRGKRGGGVVILTHNRLKVKQLNCDAGEAEILATEVSDGENKVDIVVAYMPPHTVTWTNL